MNQNYNQDSFEKGQAFEDYVERVLFPASHYELLHKTNAYDQNSQRYVGDSRKPDFRFKCILTGFEFHIEAKYRSKPYQGHYDILSSAQVETFPEIHENECPVYIALGYGGVADYPAYISLVPYEEYKEARVLVEDVMTHQIQKQLVESNLLTRHPKKNFTELTTPEVVLNHDAQAKQIEVSNKSHIQPKSRNSIIYAGLIMLLIGLLTVVYFMPIGQEDSFESDLQSRVKNYYAMSDANNLQELKAYISPNIKYWYGTENPSLDQVMNNIREYRGKNPFAESSVDWKNFDVTPKEDGSFVAIYPLEYKVKSKRNAPYKVYNLKLYTTWDENMKLVDIKEIRR